MLHCVDFDLYKTYKIIYIDIKFCIYNLCRKKF